MSLSQLFFTTLFLLLLSGCNRDVTSSNTDLSLYSEKSAMAHYLTDPDRAMTLLDSAVIVGNLCPQRAQYLKAIVIADGKQDLETSVTMIQQLIDDESWTSYSDSEEATSFRVDLYRLMASINSSTGNNLMVLRYARLGAEYSHGVPNLLGDEADCLSRLGNVLCRLGQTDEGLTVLKNAEQLVLSDDSWSSLLAYLNNAKKLYYAYCNVERYDEAKQVTQQALSRLESLRTDISQVRHVPEGIVRDSTASEEFIQYYQVPLLCYLSNIYVNTGQPDSAQYILSQLAAIPQSDNPSITQSIIHPLIALGRFDEARRRIEGVRGYLQNDTVSDSYLSLLKEERQLSILSGDQAAAHRIASNIIALGDSIYSLQQQMMLADAAAQYQLQEERLRRVDVEDKLLITVIVIILLLCILAAIGVAFYVHRLKVNHQHLKEKYVAAQQEIENLNAEEQKIGLTPEIIYERAVDIVFNQEYFKDPAFDINALLQMIPTNRSYLSLAINSQSGVNFRKWISTYRVEHAKKLLHQDPDLTKDQLAIMCGFDNRAILYRQFNAIEGIPLPQWIKENASIDCPQQ